MMVTGIPELRDLTEKEYQRIVKWVRETDELIQALRPYVQDHFLGGTDILDNARLLITQQNQEIEALKRQNKFLSDSVKIAMRDQYNQMRPATLVKCRICRTEIRWADRVAWNHVSFCSEEHKEQWLKEKGYSD